MAPDDPRHGVNTAGYLAHARDGEPPCEPCRRAVARYEQGRLLDQLSGRPRTIPSLGTHRRLQALCALGYPFARMSVPLGVGLTSVWSLACSQRTTVRSSTAQRVANLYDAWSMQPPPETTPHERRIATYARTTARKYDWAPPLAWDDIDHDPHPTGTGRDRNWAAADLVAEYEWLARQGYTRTTAAERLGITKESLEKAIERLRAKEAA